MAWAAFFTAGLVTSEYTSHPFENGTLNLVVWEAALAMAAIQATALVGLYMRRHWGRALATIAAAFWLFTMIGIPFAILVWWVLHRRWDPGVESTFTKDHPSAPAYVVGLCAFGTALALAWLYFLYIYLVNLLIQLTANSSPPVPASGWYWIATIALFFSLPLWVVQERWSGFGRSTTGERSWP